MSLFRKPQFLLNQGFILVFIIGSLFFALIFNVLRQWDLNSIESVINKEMDKHVSSLQRELDLHYEVLFGLRGLFVSSSYVTRKEFKKYTRPSLKMYPGIQALEWIPRVAYSKKSIFEKNAQLDGFLDFQFKERLKQGKMIPVQKRKEYFPVYYLEPYEGNKRALGFDLASNKTRLETLEKSRDEGFGLATQKITLIQEKGKKSGFLIFLPVYQGNTKTLLERNKNLLGFVLGVFRVGDIFEKAMFYNKNDQLSISINLYELVNSKKTILHQYHKKEIKNLETKILYQKKIKIAGRTWFVEAYPSKNSVDQSRSWYPFVVLFCGVFFTFLLAIYLRQQRSELYTSQQKNYAIIQNIISGVITIDEEGLIESINPAAKNIFGYDQKEIYGQNISFLIPPLDKKLFFEKGKELDKYLENLQEINVLNKKGKELSIAFILKKMGLATENHFIGIVTDIADRKAAERLLIQKKEQAEEANRLKSEFLNVISHELRTPLTVILGNTPLLTDQEYYPEQEDLIEIASDIDSSARHLLVLINDLLDLSKIEAGKMELKLDIIIVKELLTVVFEQFQVLAEKKSIKLELSLDSNLEILADPVRLQQIIINLVGNSIKFTEKGFIKVTVRQLGKQIQFFVEDSGCGMSDILLGDIFDAFKQVDSSSTRSAEGTGLGLAITQKLIELHQGNIFVSSEVGKGTTFVFSLPCEAVPVVVPEEVIA